MHRCPNCNARCDGNDTCRRCGMDLSLLLRTEAAAAKLLQAGITGLAANDPATARIALRRSLALQHSALAEALFGFAGAQRPAAQPPPTLAAPALPPARSDLPDGWIPTPWPGPFRSDVHTVEPV